MSVLAALQALAATGAFASRAFLPLFIVALVARFPELVSWLPLVPDHPVALSPRLDWLTSPWCLGTLGVLALLEAMAERDPDARQLLQEVDAPIKGLVACLTAFALVDPESADVLRRVAGMEVLASGLNLDARTLAALLFAVVVGAATFGLAWWRWLVLGEARAIADDLGLTKPVAWLEDAWSASSILLAIVAPVVAVVAALAAIATLRVVQVVVERAADRRRVPCPACGTACLPEAAACPACARDVMPTARGSSLAWPDAWTVTDDAARPFELLGRSRCPACGERRDPAELRALVPHPCGWPARRGPGADWPQELLAAVRRRTLPLALVAAGLGLLPVAGSVAALVLARARLAAPLQRHLRTGTRLRARWTARLLAIPLLLGSGIPLVSSACAALLVVLASWSWTRAFEGACVVTPAGSPGPPASGSPARSST